MILGRLHLQRRLHLQQSGVLGYLSRRAQGADGSYMDMHHTTKVGDGRVVNDGNSNMITRYRDDEMEVTIGPTYTVNYFIEAMISEAILNEYWLIERCVLA